MTVEWVPGDWDKVKVGQQVKVVLKDSTIVGTYNYSTRHPMFTTYHVLLKGMLGTGIDIGGASYGEMFVEAPPKVQLPTEPGIYVTYVNPPSPQIVHKITDGRWVNADDTYYMTDEQVAKCLPLTRLEPVPETAKKLFDRVERYLHSAAPIAALNDLRREFGVTNV